MKNLKRMVKTITLVIIFIIIVSCKNINREEEIKEKLLTYTENTYNDSFEIIDINQKRTSNSYDALLLKDKDNVYFNVYEDYDGKILDNYAESIVSKKFYDELSLSDKFNIENLEFSTYLLGIYPTININELKKLSLKEIPEYDNLLRVIVLLRFNGEKSLISDNISNIFDITSYIYENYVTTNNGDVYVHVVTSNKEDKELDKVILLYDNVYSSTISPTVNPNSYPSICEYLTFIYKGVNNITYVEYETKNSFNRADDGSIKDSIDMLNFINNS